MYQYQFFLNNGEFLEKYSDREKILEELKKKGEEYLEKGKKKWEEINKKNIYIDI